MSFFTELLTSGHEKSNFSSGNFLLDNYLQKQASQDVKRKLAACFVVNKESTNRVIGYYTLSNSNIPASWISQEFKKRIPPAYLNLPTTLIGRLAIDSEFQGQGVGKLLLIDALKRSFELSFQLGSCAVVVDPIDSVAEGFYAKYGFVKLPESGKIFLSMQTTSQLF